VAFPFAGQIAFRWGFHPSTAVALYLAGDPQIYGNLRNLVVAWKVLCAIDLGRQAVRKRSGMLVLHEQILGLSRHDSGSSCSFFALKLEERA
jgi:hypothetical protein